MIDMKQIKQNVSNKIKTPNPTSETDYAYTETKPRTPSRSEATIGASIEIKGDVTGSENLVIEGNIEGNISLNGHDVIIGKQGKVSANVDANNIIVEGELNGDLNGSEKVVIKESGNVHGNIVAPRVSLEDGALFKGSIEMEPNKMKSIPKQDDKKPNSDNSLKSA